MAKTITFDDAVKQEQFDQINLGVMAQEVAETHALCDSTHSPVVYSHNDLLAGNILVLGEDLSLDKVPLDVQFIDFEYGCYGFRGFDWGVHRSFCFSQYIDKLNPKTVYAYYTNKDHRIKVS